MAQGTYGILLVSLDALYCFLVQSQCLVSTFGSLSFCFNPLSMVKLIFWERLRKMDFIAVAPTALLQTLGSTIRSLSGVLNVCTGDWTQLEGN